MDLGFGWWNSTKRLKVVKWRKTRTGRFQSNQLFEGAIEARHNGFFQRYSDRMADFVVEVPNYEPRKKTKFLVGVGWIINVNRLTLGKFPCSVKSMSCRKSKSMSP
jgi:hypothetical protein